MNKEDILTEINNNVSNPQIYPSRSDCCDIEEQKFQDVVLDNIECYRITFCNCKFKNVQFIDNKIEWIEFEECEFEDTVFRGKHENVLLTIMDCSFKKCKVSDFEFKGYDAQSEIAGCRFESCIFNNVNIEADLSVLGGSVVGSQGTDLSAKMNMIMNVKFSDSLFSNVNLQAAVLKNKFNNTLFENIKLDEESVVENNILENCKQDDKPIREEIC